MNIKRALIIPDVHRPFYDIKAYNLMLEVTSYLGVSEVVLLGDYADFYAVSRHEKHPRVGALLETEIDSVRSGLDQIDSLFPKAKKVYLEGNHEKRLEAYLVREAPALFGLTECRTLFGINQRPLWSYIPFSRAQFYKVLGVELYAFHRPTASNPRAHLGKSQVSSIYGDVHKIERAHSVSLDGRHLVTSCPGWLGDVRSPVFDYMASTPQWQLGFSTVEIDPSGEFFVHQHEIKNHKTIVNGKVFKG